MPCWAVSCKSDDEMSCSRSATTCTTTTGNDEREGGTVSSDNGSSGSSHMEAQEPGNNHDNHNDNDNDHDNSKASTHDSTLDNHDNNYDTDYDNSKASTHDSTLDNHDSTHASPDANDYDSEEEQAEGPLSMSQMFNPFGALERTITVHRTAGRLGLTIAGEQEARGFGVYVGGVDNERACADGLQVGMRIARVDDEDVMDLNRGDVVRLLASKSGPSVRISVMPDDGGFERFEKAAAALHMQQQQQQQQQCEDDDDDDDDNGTSLPFAAATTSSSCSSHPEWDTFTCDVDRSSGVLGFGLIGHKESSSLGVYLTSVINPRARAAGLRRGLRLVGVDGVDVKHAHKRDVLALLAGSGDVVRVVACDDAEGYDTLIDLMGGQIVDSSPPLVVQCAHVRKEAGALGLALVGRSSNLNNLYVNKHHPRHAASLQAGDCVLAVNGDVLVDRREERLLARAHACADGDALSLTVARATDTAVQVPEGDFTFDRRRAVSARTVVVSLKQARAVTLVNRGLGALTIADIADIGGEEEEAGAGQGSDGREGSEGGGAGGGGQHAQSQEKQEKEKEKEKGERERKGKEEEEGEAVGQKEGRVSGEGKGFRAALSQFVNRVKGRGDKKGQDQESTTTAAEMMMTSCIPGVLPGDVLVAVDGRMVNGMSVDEVVELLGQGGMGAVYRARDLQVDREVALKVLAVSAVGGAAAATRFKREADAVASLDHPGILPVYGYGTDPGHRVHWIAMQLVQGQDYRESVLGVGREPIRRAAKVTHAVALALSHAHAQGVIHRDVKPSNVMLAGERIYLVDFGIARLDSAPALTVAPAAMGTPGFMAPEQALEEEATQAADVYALGATLFWALTQELPLRFDSLRGLQLLHAEAAPARSPRALRPEIPRDLEAWLRRLLQKRPEDRFTRAADALNGLNQIGGSLLPSSAQEIRTQLAGEVTQPNISAGASLLSQDSALLDDCSTQEDAVSEISTRILDIDHIAAFRPRV